MKNQILNISILILVEQVTGKNKTRLLNCVVSCFEMFLLSSLLESASEISLNITDTEYIDRSLFFKAAGQANVKIIFLLIRPTCPIANILSILNAPLLEEIHIDSQLTGTQEDYDVLFDIFQAKCSMKIFKVLTVTGCNVKATQHWFSRSDASLPNHLAFQYCHDLAPYLNEICFQRYCLR